MTVMIQRLMLITVMQIALYFIGIPLLIALELSCQRLGNSCPLMPTAKVIPDPPTRALSTARLAR
ncbi:MAG: hypothetical protein VKP70_03695 [Cyanobacteriota bacterium]|nr:hypothetical protein [Cyanobacteriota bacterium]